MRVFWNYADEIAPLEARAKKLIDEDPRLSIMQAVNRAQMECLPADRRRKIAGKHSIPEPLRSNLATYVPGISKTPAPEPYDGHNRRRNQPTAADILQQSFVEALLEVGRRVLCDPELRALVRSAIREPVPGNGIPYGPPPNHTKAAPSPQPDFSARSPRPPHVLVVGCKDANRGALAANFPDLKLRYWHDGNLNLLRDQAKGADAVFFLTKGNSHKAFDLVRSTGADVHKIGGSQTAAIAAIKKYLTTWQQRQVN